MGICQGLASDNANNLFAAWKGETGDDRVFYSTFNGISWSGQQAMPANSSVGPALAFLNGTLYAAWKGIYGDNRLFSAEFNGTNWVNQNTIPGNSDIGPTLASWNGYLCAAWKGEADLRMFYALYDGNDWLPQQQFAYDEIAGGFYSCTGPSLVVFNRTLYAMWRGAIQNFDESIYYSRFNGTTWSYPIQVSPTTPPTVLSSIGPSLAVFGSKLYMFWKGEGTDERVFYGWFNSEMQWQGATQITGVTCNSSIGVAVSTFGNPERLYAIWKGSDSDQQIFCASFDGSNWTAEPTIPGNTGQDMATMPFRGLGSDSNYILSSNCVPITALSVSLEITQEIACSAGFSIQLNCYTTKNQKAAWQQYILAYQPGAPCTFQGQVDNWTTNTEIINKWTPVICSFQGPNIPVGTIFVITLLFDSTTHKVTGAEFYVGIPGVAGGNRQLILDQLKTDDPNSVLTPASDMSPIVAFQLNFVGQDGGITVLSTGAGNITYSATPALTALPDYPACVEYDEPTGEKANTVYGQLPLGASQSITQSFTGAAGGGFF